MQGNTCSLALVKFDCRYLTLKASITTAADDIHFFSLFFREIRLDVSSRQRILMKNQALFSSKGKSKKIKLSSAAIFVWRFQG